MKKTMMAGLMVLLAVLSSSAAAEWVRVHNNEKLVAFADSSSIRKKGNILKVLSLFDFKTENLLSDGEPYNSIIRETEFNCKENLQRMISFSIHSGRMGKGKVLEIGNDPQDWKPVSRENIAVDMKDYTCGHS